MADQADLFKGAESDKYTVSGKYFKKLWETLSV